MKSKKPSSAKVVDISRPKKRTAHADVPSAPQLVISKRSLIIPISDADTSDEAPVTPSAEPIKARQTVKIEPLSAPALASTESPTAPAKEAPVPQSPVTPPAPAVPASEEPVAKQPAPVAATPLQPLSPQPKLEPAQPKPPIAAPATTPVQPAAPQPKPEPAPPKPADTPPDASEEAPELPTPATGADGKSTKANVQKALEDAKRQEEIQGYITNHNFFVPINARARKRSLRVSIALTFLELLLGLFLLNLMLDAGVIELLEKIPHTHFFDL